MNDKIYSGPLYYLNIVAIMTVFLYCSAGGFEASAVQTCIEAWPEISSANIRLMLMLPALTQSVIMLITGAVVGRLLSYRCAASVGMILISLGGCIPFFYHPSWSFVVIIRCLGLGCGGGLLGIRNALLLRSVPKSEAEKWTGYGSSVIALSSVVFSPIVGLLASRGWNYSFLINAGAIPCLILIFVFLREPQKVVPEQEKYRKKLKDENKYGSTLDKRVFLYAGLLFLATCLVYTIVLGISTLFAEKNIGSPALAGVCISIYSVAGMIINLFLAKLIQIAGKRLLGLCFLFWTTGVALTLFTHSVALSMIGLVICGLGYFPVFSLFQLYNAQIQANEHLAFSSMIILIGNQLAVVASNLFIALSDAVFHFRNSETASSYLMTIILLIILGLFGLTGKISPGLNSSKLR